MAACYSPDLESPLGFQLPVDLYTGEMRPTVWARWLAHDPVEIAEAHANALRSLGLLYMDCGNRDEHALHYGARLLSKRLTAAGVAHRYEEYPGTHQRSDHRYDVSFEAIANALGVKTSSSVIA
jgi:enterochelin esterase family protein